MAATFFWLWLDDVKMKRDPSRRSMAKFGLNYRIGGHWWFGFMWLPIVNLLTLAVLGPGIVAATYRKLTKRKRNAS